MGWIRETLILDGYKDAINGYREDLYNMALNVVSLITKMLTYVQTYET